MNVPLKGLTCLLWRLIVACHISSTLVLLMVMGHIHPESGISGSLQLQDAYAFVGVCFEYRLPSFMNKHNIEISEAGTGYLPSWLLYNKSSSCLEGIPTAVNEGIVYIHVYYPTYPVAQEDVFAINVVFPGMSVPISRNQNLTEELRSGREGRQDEYGLHYCKSFEARFSVSLMLALSLESTAVNQRIKVVKNFSEFITRKPFEVVLSSRNRSAIHSLKGAKIILSSLEHQQAKHSWNSEISWHIACNSFTKAEDLEQVLNHNIKSGTLANVLGCPVIGWYLLATFPKDKRHLSLRRQRRQLDVLQTPFATPTPTKTLPSTSMVGTVHQTYSVLISSIPTMHSLTNYQTVTPSSLVSTFSLVTTFPGTFHSTQVRPSESSSQYVSSLVLTDTPLLSSFAITSGLSSSQQYFTTASTNQFSQSAASGIISFMSTNSIQPTHQSTQLISSVVMTYLSSDYRSIHSSLFTNILSPSYSKIDITSTTLTLSLNTGLSILSKSQQYSTVVNTPSLILMTKTVEPSGLASGSPHLMTSTNFKTTVDKTADISSSGDFITTRYKTESSFIPTTFLQQSPMSSYSFGSFQSTTTPHTPVLLTSSPSLKVVGTSQILSSEVVYSSPQVNTFVKTSRYNTLTVLNSQISTSLQPSPSDTEGAITSRMSTRSPTLSFSRSKFSRSISQSVQTSSTTFIPITTVPELVSSQMHTSQVATNILSSTPVIFTSQSLEHQQSTLSLQLSQSSDLHLFFSSTINKPVVSSHSLSIQTQLPSSSFKALSSLQTNDLTVVSTNLRSLKTTNSLLPYSTISNEMTVYPSPLYSTQLHTSQGLVSRPSLTGLLFSSSEIQSSFQSLISKRSSTTTFASVTHRSQPPSFTPRLNTHSITFQTSHTLPSSSVVMAISSLPVTLFTTRMQSVHSVASTHFTPPLVTIPMILSTSRMYTSFKSSPDLGSLSRSTTSEVSSTSFLHQTSTSGEMLSSEVVTLRTNIPESSKRSDFSAFQSLMPSTFTQYSSPSMFTTLITYSYTSKLLMSSQSGDALRSSFSINETRQTSLPSETPQGTINSVTSAFRSSPSLFFTSSTVLGTTAASRSTHRQLFTSPSLGPPSTFSSSPDLLFTRTASLGATAASHSSPSLLFTRTASFGATAASRSSPSLLFTRTASLGATAASHSSTGLLFTRTASLGETTASHGSTSLLFTRTASLGETTTYPSSTGLLFTRTASLGETTAYPSSTGLLFTSTASLGETAASRISPSQMFTSSSFGKTTASRSLLFKSSSSAAGTSVFISPTMQSVFPSSFTSETSPQHSLILSSLRSVSSSLLLSLSTTMTLSSVTMVTQGTSNVPSMISSTRNIQQTSFDVSETLTSIVAPSMHVTPIGKTTSLLSIKPSKVQTSVSLLDSSVITGHIVPSTSSSSEDKSSLVLVTTLSPSHVTLVSSLILASRSDVSHRPSVTNSLDTHSLSQTRSIRSTPVLPSLPHLTSSPMFSSASTVAMTSLLPTIQTSSHISPSLVSSRYSSEIVSSSYSLPTTTAVPTDGVTTFKPTPSTVSVNGVPILLNPIDIIVLTSGEVFKYHIPTDTFYDKEDGNTRNLSLSLMDEDYRSITSSSWIFLDQESQSLEGIVVGEDLISETNQFYLAATNSAGRVAYDALTVEVRANEAEYSHQFQVNLSLNYSVFQENVTALYQFFTRLSFHYGSELSELNVFSVVSGSVIITYSNDSIPKTFCDLNSIQVAMGLMVEDNGSVKPEFQETLGRQFPVTSVKLKLIGRCVSFITTSPPDVSFIPQTAQHKLWLSMSTAFIALLCLLLCGFLVYLYSRNKHPGEELLLSNEKPVYIGARKPVILANERSIRRNPRRSYPAVLPDDISPFKPQVKADIEIPLRRLPSDPFLQAQGFDNPVQRIPPPVYCPNPNGGALGGRSLGGRGNPPAYQAPPPYFPPNSYMENKL